MIFEQWEIVLVPFPFVESAGQKKRPVLILSTDRFNQANKHFIGAMITTSKKVSWFGDTDIEHLTSTGLLTPSLIRAKVFTLDNRLIQKRLGFLSPKDVQQVKATFAQCWLS